MSQKQVLFFTCLSMDLKQDGKRGQCRCLRPLTAAGRREEGAALGEPRQDPTPRPPGGLAGLGVPGPHHGHL